MNRSERGNLDLSAASFPFKEFATRSDVMRAFRCGLFILFLLPILRSQPRQKQNPADQQQVDSDNPQTKPSVTVVNQLYPQAENRDKAKSEKYQDGVAILEAVSTFLLFVATAALCYVAVLQRKTMEAHKQSLESMSTHMERGLTETQKAAEAAKGSADAAKQSFIASHRPKLTIRFVITASDIGQPGVGMSGDFLVFNTGGTTATLRRCYSEVIFGDSLPMRSSRYVEGPSEDLSEIKLLLPGQSAILKFPTDGPKVLDVDDRINIRRRQKDASANPRSGTNLPCHNLFLIGWIGYTDESKRTRRAGFCRKYDFTAKRFVVEPDPDYEYED